MVRTDGWGGEAAEESVEGGRGRARIRRPSRRRTRRVGLRGRGWKTESGRVASRAGSVSSEFNRHAIARQMQKCHSGELLDGAYYWSGGASHIFVSLTAVIFHSLLGI